MHALVKESKNDVRWELADISNRLNKLLKYAVAAGPRHSHDIQIHDLRARRDELLNKLQNL